MDGYNCVTSIENGAFEDCTGLTSITIPNSVTAIGGDAFSGCTGLTSITVASGNTTYDSRNNCNAIIKKSTNELVVGCKNTTVPNSVTSIYRYAFYGCTGLTSISIPNSVRLIWNDAFYGCTGLTSITISNSVTSIGDGAFGGCTGLTSIIGPNNSVYTSIPAQNVVLKGTEVVLGCKNTQLDLLLGYNITYPALDTLRIGFNATISSSTPFLDINPSILSYPVNLEPSLQPTNR